MLRAEVTHATDLDLLTVILGDRKQATKICEGEVFALFAPSFTAR